MSRQRCVQRTAHNSMVLRPSMTVLGGGEYTLLQASGGAMYIEVGLHLPNKVV